MEHNSDAGLIIQKKKKLKTRCGTEVISECCATDFQKWLMALAHKRLVTQQKEKSQEEEYAP